jgi:hypothetical protein
MQPGRNSGNLRVAGFLYGYKAVNEAIALPLVQEMRRSFRLQPAP